MSSIIDDKTAADRQRDKLNVLSKVMILNCGGRFGFDEECSCSSVAVFCYASVPATVMTQALCFQAVRPSVRPTLMNAISKECLEVISSN